MAEKELVEPVMESWSSLHPSWEGLVLSRYQPNAPDGQQPGTASIGFDFPACIAGTHMV